MGKIVGRTFVYVLKDPRSGEICYLGKSDDPQDRWRKHYNGREDSQKGKWIADLREQGLKPQLEILEEVDRAVGYEKEHEHARRLTESGVQFLNSHFQSGKVTGKSNKDPMKRFWKFVNKNGPVMPGMSTACWIWTGKKGKRGHGQFGVQDEAGNWHTVQAHRWLWKQEHGPLDDALVLDHQCENQPCIRGDHLTPTTRAANTMRGNSPHAVNARKTHCPKGHPLVSENLYLVKNQRRCRLCSIAVTRRGQAKRMLDPAEREAHNTDRRERRHQQRLRNPLPSKAPRTTCRRGHAWVPENEEWYQNARHCKQCRTDRAKAAQAVRVRKPHHKSVVTHCPQGHPYDEANTYLGKRGDRVCRACARERAAEKRAAGRLAVAA